MMRANEKVVADDPDARHRTSVERFPIPRFMLDHVLGALVSDDAFLACLIPALLFLSTLYFSGIPSLSELRRNVAEVITGRGRTAFGHFSVERAILSYQQYAKLSLSELATMQRSYFKIGRIHKRVGYDLGYPAKLNRLQKAIAVNTKVTEGIVQLAQEHIPGKLSPTALYEQSKSVQGDLQRVRESLKHFVRDWSEEGREERAMIFGPILDLLKEASPVGRDGMRVLVPGSGLGRLAWEISQLGEWIQPLIFNSLNITGRLYCYRERAVLFHEPCAPLSVV